MEQKRTSANAIVDYGCKGDELDIGARKDGISTVLRPHLTGWSVVVIHGLNSQRLKTVAILCRISVGFSSTVKYRWVLVTGWQKTVDLRPVFELQHGQIKVRRDRDDRSRQIISSIHKRDANFFRVADHVVAGEDVAIC